MVNQTSKDYPYPHPKEISALQKILDVARPLPKVGYLHYLVTDRFLVAFVKRSGRSEFRACNGDPASCFHEHHYDYAVASASLDPSPVSPRFLVRVPRVVLEQVNLRESIAWVRREGYGPHLSYNVADFSNTP